MGKKEVDVLIQRQVLCRIAFKGGQYPYIAPFQYAVVHGNLYFHFTDYGKKIRLLRANKNVCVEIEEYAPDLSEFRFVSLRGKLNIVTEKEERAKAIAKLRNDGQERLSKKFLIAHGFNKHQDWSSLEPGQPMIIVRLDEVAERIGLKSD